jgi:murein DD-endopeptidase MepM/ murein hydrolase activator NlpD
MIIHNNNLATLYAHLNTVNVSTDQYVGRGQVIGGSGSTGFSSGPHLHFEVRSNGIPVNPLNYIR